MRAREIAETLGKARREGKEWLGLCPCHDDHDPSLSITEQNGTLLVVCRVGCEQKRVVAELKRRGLWHEPQKHSDDIVAVYNYRDADGAVRYQVVRKVGKKFLQRRPNGSLDQFIWNVHGVEPLPYRLPELLNDPTAPVYVVEGEKDADNLAELGLVVTCNHGGASKWRPEISRYLTGRDVIILPDNDVAGRVHAADVAAKLAGIAKSVRTVELPGLPDKGDVSDWIAAGGTVEQLEALVAQDQSNDHDKAAALTAALNAYAWATLDIPRPVRLLGELITPATRTFLVGTTGVGKTLIGYEWAAGMGAGTGFLHWTCDRPSRWIIIDGEMPDQLIKDRISEVLRRHAVPPENLLLYSTSHDAPGLAQMPPLNTEPGHAWVLQLAEIIKPDGILFDNLMSLSPGNHSDPETWLQTVPLVMELTRRGFAQIWCDHTGWNTDRQYGTSIKGWCFDNVGILTPPPAEAREEGCLILNLTFDPPYAKARRRTPDNQRDFDPITLRLSHGEWSSGESGKTSEALTPEGRAWLNDVQNLFDQPRVAQERNVSPGGVFCVRFSVSRETLREHLRKCGRIGDGPHANLTEADRTKLRYWLNKLRDNGKIGVDGDLIWLA